VTARSFFVLRVLAALGFASAAVNHAVHAAHGEGVVVRHEVFVGINLLLGALLVLRPRIAIVPIALLSLQQIPSHGRDFVQSLHEANVDWPSLGVVFFFPAVLALLVAERRATRARSP
jgi:hypothetical protein